MFGKKQPKTEEKIDLDVVTIPKEFYAGANPVVKFKDVEDIVELPKKHELTESEKLALDKANAAGSTTSLHPANILTNKKFVFIGGLILFLLLIGGASAYYFLFQKKTAPVQNPPIVGITPNEQIATTTIEIITVTTTTETATTTEPVVKELPIDFPSTLLGVSSDYDNDNISDVAETLYNTDPTDADTDADKYPDGHELYYLYNPAGFEPMKLADSGLITDYKNPTYGYSVYLPNDWAAGEADSENKEVLFSALNGEYIMIRVFDFFGDQTFSDWFFEYAPEEKLTALTDFTTAFNLSGKKRGDGLVYYFMNEKSVYVITYHATDEAVVSYKIAMDVLARSFRLPEIKDQTLESESAPGFIEQNTSTEAITEQTEETESSLTEEETEPTNEEDENTEENLVI